MSRHDRRICFSSRSCTEADALFGAILQLFVCRATAHGLTQRPTALTVYPTHDRQSFNSRSHTEADVAQEDLDHVPMRSTHSPHRGHPSRALRFCPDFYASTHSLTQRPTCTCGLHKKSISLQLTASHRGRRVYIHPHNVQSAASTHSLTQRPTPSIPSGERRLSASTHGLTQRPTILYAKKTKETYASTHGLTQRPTAKLHSFTRSFAIII